MSEMGIGSHQSWASGSSKSVFSYSGALRPTVALKIPGHLVLPPKTHPGTSCLPVCSRSAGEPCPWVGLFTGASAPCTGSVPEGRSPSTILFLSFQTPSRDSSLIFLGRMRGVSSVFLWYLCLSCICPLVCAQHPEQCPAHIGAQQIPVETVDGYIFILYCNLWMVCLPTTVWGQGSCHVFSAS